MTGLQAIVGSAARAGRETMSSGCPRVTKSALGPQSKPPDTDRAQGRRRPAVPTAGGQLDGCEEQLGGTAALGNAQTNLGDKGL